MYCPTEFCTVYCAVLCCTVLLCVMTHELYCSPKHTLCFLSSLRCQVEETRIHVEALYARCDPASIAHASLETFKDAISVVWSRQVNVMRVPVTGGASKGETHRGGVQEEGEAAGAGEEGGGGRMALMPELFLVPLGDWAVRSFDAEASWQVMTFSGNWRF